MNIIIVIFVIIFVLASFYLSFLPHATQCNMLKMVLPNCFHPWLHLVGGLVFFVLAIALYNYEYILNLLYHKA
jgi:hypothetical protein